MQSKYIGVMSSTVCHGRACVAVFEISYHLSAFLFFLWLSVACIAAYVNVGGHACAYVSGIVDILFFLHTLSALAGFTALFSFEK